MDDDLKEFINLVEEWSEYCRSDETLLFSFHYELLDHSACRRLIELGEPAISLIMEQYKKDNLPWGYILREITGIDMAKKKGYYDSKEVKREWMEWWEKKRKRPRNSTLI
ncbi:MAG: hypothetical protein GY795_25765 [Desulfobacterales bacterium]|nr:hypothetical protein [Desulfobacterales bacterium]